MKNNLIKAIALLAVFLLLTVQLAACKTPEDDVKETGGTTAASPVGSDQVTDPAETTLNSGLPEMDMKNEIINVLAWKEAGLDEFNSDGISGDLYLDNVYQRNMSVEETLKVHFEFNREVRGDVNHSTEFITHLQNVINAGSRDYDLIAGYSQTMATMSSMGLYHNLLDTEYIDFEREWWPEKLVSELTINNKLYICSGDIAPTTIYHMYAVFFNKKTITDLSLENPHELVADNKWTLDKFIEMSQNIYNDENGDSQKDESDSFGFMTSILSLDPWFYAIGSKMVEMDADGKRLISPSFGGEKTISLIERIQNLLWRSAGAMISDPSNYDGSSIRHVTGFSEGRVLFCVDTGMSSTRYFVSSEGLSFGILPLPKYDEQQSDYISLMRNTVTFFAIPVDSEDPDAISAVVQCFAFNSYKYLVPAIFEESLKLKYADAEADANMYDIVRRTISYDIGRIYSKVLIGQHHFRDAIVKDNGRWASVVRTQQTAFKKSLDSLEEAFE